eukprot:scaffold2215_cov125-Skeletonema_marinoi.AAC.9
MKDVSHDLQFAVGTTDLHDDLCKNQDGGAVELELKGRTTPLIIIIVAIDTPRLGRQHQQQSSSSIQLRQNKILQN